MPKPVREELQLSPGDSLELNSFEDQVVLRPVRPRVGMKKKQGIWVIDLREPVTAAQTDRVLGDIRRERERAALGSKLTSQGRSGGRRSKR